MKLGHLMVGGVLAGVAYYVLRDRADASVVPESTCPNCGYSPYDEEEGCPACGPVLHDPPIVAPFPSCPNCGHSPYFQEEGCSACGYGNPIVILACPACGHELSYDTRSDSPPPFSEHVPCPACGYPIEEITTGITVEVNLIKGQTLVTLASDPLDPLPQSVYPGNVGIYYWEPVTKSYQAPSGIAGGVAYWVAYTEPATLLIPVRPDQPPGVTYWVDEANFPGHVYNPETKEWEVM